MGAVGGTYNSGGHNVSAGGENQGVIVEPHDVREREAIC